MGMVSTVRELLGKITSQQHQRSVSRADTWRDLARDIASGKEADPEVVDGILIETGRTCQDLETAVGLMQQRLQARAKIDRQAQIREEIEKLKGELTDTEEQRRAAEKRFCEAIEQQVEKIRGLERESLESPAAERKLINTFPDEKLVAENQEIGDKLLELQRQERRFIERRLDAKANLADVEDKKPIDYETLVVRYTSLIDELTKAIGNVIEQREPLLSRRAEIERLMLEP